MNRKKTSYRIHFGNQVKKRRKELNLTQKDLATKCGLHPAYIGSVERGERNIAFENIIKLTMALEASLDIMIKDKEDAEV